jgi:hypothetical protein
MESSDRDLDGRGSRCRCEVVGGGNPLLGVVECVIMQGGGGGGSGGAKAETGGAPQSISEGGVPARDS